LILLVLYVFNSDVCVVIVNLCEEKRTRENELKSKSDHRGYVFFVIVCTLQCIVRLHAFNDVSQQILVVIVLDRFA